MEGTAAKGGTYNVLANCAASPSAGVFERGNLIVWATRALGYVLRKKHNG